MANVGVDADRIEAARASGEVLLIRYHGGSDPGAVREILPVLIKTDRVKARCYTSGGTKDFMFAKIELIDRPSDASSDDIWSPDRKGPAPMCSAELCPDLWDEWKMRGWHLSFSDDPENGQFRIGLHRRKKRGVGHLKHPSLTLSFERDAHDLVVQPDGGVEHVYRGPRVRPWVVGGGKTTRTFADHSKAMEAFVELVAARSP